MPDRVGQQLGNYRLLRLLGRGGFAEVYLGEHLYLKRRAAIKVLHTSLEDEKVDQFLAEGQTLARLTHPNIVQVFDFAVEQGIPFLAMGYAPRGTLRWRHPRGTCLSLATTAAYVKHIAAALQYAHTHHVIHRDVKPENMLLGPDQQILLSDFGMALLAPSPEQLSTQAMAGTLLYMAPEQIRGKPGFASDQYSLGIVVYEWLCGVRPFEGSHWQVAYQQVSELPRPLRDHDPSLPQAVEEVVLKALAKDPQERFVSVQMFAQAFERASAISQLDLRSGTEVIAPLDDNSPAQPITPAVTSKRVFVSASHADDNFVAQLKADLQQRRIEVWYEDPDNTQNSLDQEDVVRQAIRAVDVVLLVVSLHARSSRIVKEHLRIAGLYQRRLVFMWASGEEIADVLPQEWGRTIQIDLIDAREGRYEAALDELVTCLQEADLSVQSVTTAPVATQRTTPPVLSNVFLFNQQLPSPGEFFGRARERLTLLDRTYKQASTSIVGPRRIGKTWLMRYLQLVAPEKLGSRFHLSYLDATAQQCTTVAGLAASVLEILTSQKYTFGDKQEALLVLEQEVQDLARDHVLVLCIDEFEGFDNRREFDLHFFTALRAMAHKDLCLVVASKQPLIDIVGDYGKTSGFFNVFKQCTLEPFSKKEAAGFVQSKGEQAHLTKQERQYLLHYGQVDGAYWPIRLQLVGETLLQDKILAIQENDPDYYRPADLDYWQAFERRLEQTYRGVVR